MQRFPLLLRQRRVQLLASLAVLVLALAVVVGSGAVFTSTSANPNNTFTAGILHHTNSNAGAAILTATKMVPGHSYSGTVDIKNDGDVDGTFSLSISHLSDTPGANGGKLSDVLQLKVVDTTAGNAVVYDGPINAVSAANFATIAAGATHTFAFTVTFPDGGTPSGATTGDNAYQGSSMSVEFDWTAVSI